MPIRVLAKAAAFVATGLFCLMIFSAGTPVMAQGYYFGGPGFGVYVGPRYPYYGPRYYRRYGYYRGGNCTYAGCCPPGMSVQGGVCKPYRYGPWDWY